MTRSDYIEALLQSCTPILPTFDVHLAGGGRVALRTDTLMDIAKRGCASDEFCGALVTAGAIVDIRSLGRGLLLLAHHVLTQHLHRSFAEERLAFEPALLTFLDRYDVPEEQLRRLAKRRVWVLGDLLTLPPDERVDLLDYDAYQTLVDDLARRGLRDLSCDEWPARHRVVPLAITSDAATTVRDIPVTHLPLDSSVSHALASSHVDCVGDVTAEEWLGIVDAYAISAELAARTESVFADYGIDLTAVCLLQPDEDLFGSDDSREP